LSVCLPLLIFPRTIKSRSSLLAPAHPGGPGKKGRKTVVVVWVFYKMRIALFIAVFPPPLDSNMQVTECCVQFYVNIIYKSTSGVPGVP